ncbi:helix-turn-helix domain-containing protein [Chryseobacterium indologenes]|uniref:AraC-type DNA-binding protein n=1 Tax=Chryseobacterium oranimense TaxID=421058 RepID=A0A1M5U8S7_9FLAO|nr:MULTISPECIES: AraC family transcriptional regulator [Chryseobacterium]ASE61014.1 AraC family transcriptional regulator [Chryseobacterium indologenes]QPQ53746.1 helix-turn-helix domain-containing protein [Chryseobacterium indologenes]SFK40571.1 AraC-type DNA-binding protein [Chryseobacterium indologenes]SHH59318.1 AraC-type DNA-binding protein [Chryseobacterium oranimense]SUX52637.1 L-rhamnose operon regulatory protein rhaS [Chryseobacterium indologenes]
MKVYSIKDIIPEVKQFTQYYVGVFEDTPDPEIEWPHRHAFYSLVWFTKGSGINVIDFDEHEILPNRIFAINPKQVHNWNYSSDSCGYTLLIDEPFAKHLNIDFSFPFVDLQKDDLQFIEEIFKRMLSGKNQLTAIPYLFSLLNNSRASRINNTITKFKKLVSENLDKNLTIEQYAEKIGVTIEIFNQTCKAETGFTAKQLQLDVKITEAKRLLLYSSLNSSEIAFKLGFEDNSYFSRIFKKKTDFSPAEFREKYHKNEKKS